MKKAFSALAVLLALCVALAGCHISTPDSVGAIGGIDIPSGLYLLAQFDAYQQAAQLAESEQDPADVKAFLKETVTLDEESGETALVSDYVADKTLETLRLYAAVETRFEELGGELTPDQLAQADSYAQQLLDNYGEVYTENGIGLASLQLYQRNLAKSAALLNLVYGPEGETPVSEDQLLDHLDEMIYAVYLSVPLYDPETFAFADEEQTDEMLALAEEAVASWAASTPPPPPISPPAFCWTAILRLPSPRKPPTPSAPSRWAKGPPSSSPATPSCCWSGWTRWRPRPSIRCGTRSSPTCVLTSSRTR